MPPVFTADLLPALCDQLASRDAGLALVLERYGYPPFWARPNNFESLVHFILEQQVSLASARAALEKLRAYIGEITPEHMLQLTDAELRACYFSRQKASYVRAFSQAVSSGKLDITALAKLSDEAVRAQLLQIKGIGHWTVDVYLILVLHRADIFPLGDIAALNALRSIKQLPADTDKTELLRIVDQWRPYRSIGAILLWHYYLSKQGRTYT